MSKKASIVSVLKTAPETVIKDYGKLMDLANYKKAIKKQNETILKLNLSWSLYYPACSTEPWQLDATIQKLKQDKYKDIIPVENKTVVTNPIKGCKGNKWNPIFKKHNLNFQPLTNVDWVEYIPKAEMLEMYNIFKEGLYIPKMFPGKNIIHLPTVKCVDPETLIATSKGLIKIKDMFGISNSLKKEEQKTFEGRTLIFNGNKKKKMKFVKASVWRNKSKGDCYEINLKSGKDVTVSSEHPFLTQYGWVKASDIRKEFHKIATPRKLDCYRPKNVKLNIKKLKIKKSHNKIILPKKSSNELCKWIAYVISEGSIENREKENYAIHFTNYNKIILSDFKKISKKLFNIEFKEKKSKKEELFVHSKLLVDFLVQINSLDDKGKKIPAFLYSCSDKEIVSFITSYIECDGNINLSTPQISITTTNKQDAKLIQLLFNRLGIVSFLTNRKNGRFKDVSQITIYSKEITKFNKLNPSFITEKNKTKFKKALKLINKRKNNFLTNYDFIPVTKEEILPLLNKIGKNAEPFKKRKRGNRFLQSITYYNKKVPRESFNYLLNALKSKLVSINKYNPTDFEHLIFLSNNALIWEDIKKIKKVKTKKDLYDITIEDKMHNFIGNGIILHNTHGHTTMTGSMKNAFGGLITEKRHHCHKRIHEVLVDLLNIQKEIHSGIFTVMDGTVCGNGAGPRTMLPEIKDYILASEDSVAVDAISAKMMGFDPMKIKFLKLAHDQGLGCADIDQIDIVGENIKNVNFKFHTEKSPVVFMDQALRTKYPIIEPILFHTPLFKTCIFGSEFYHDHVWYNMIGKKRINQFMKTKWGKLFKSY